MENDFLLNAVRVGGAVFFGLNLSSAFDTIVHPVLLNRLSSHCVIRSTSLVWFTSYLTQRTQLIAFNSIESHQTEIKYGVPQGSVIGPNLYVISVNFLLKIDTEWGIQVQQYSDDANNYSEFPFPPGLPDPLNALRMLSHGASDMMNWFAFNWVKVNPDKSDFLFFTPAGLADKLPRLPLRVRIRVLDPCI